MNKKIVNVPISVVVPMRNAATTVIYTLSSLQKQNYPIEEIIIVDNASTDNSVTLVKGVIKKSKIPIKLIIRKKNKGAGASYNEGVENTKSPIVIFIHSDCVLPTKNEVKKLVAPYRKNEEIVATYSTVLFTQAVWEKYDFWEKYFFARVVGQNISGFTTKFDSVRRDVFLRIGGVDTVNFSVGNEDGNLHDKLRKVGNVVRSEAVVSHLHFIGEGYTFRKMLDKTRGYARAYGSILRVKGLSFHSGLVFLIKPGLAILPFLPNFHVIGLVILLVFSFLYTKKMFLTKSTLSDPKIMLVPFVNIFILYYETFWIGESFFFGKNKVE